MKNQTDDKSNNTIKNFTVVHDDNVSCCVVCDSVDRHVQLWRERRVQWSTNDDSTDAASETSAADCVVVRASSSSSSASPASAAAQETETHAGDH